MEIKFYVNNSEVNKIKKALTNEITFTGNLRSASNVVQPVILVNASNPTGYNYVYIPEFKRYYFITEITAIRTGLFQISLKSDPLMSYADAILNCKAILNETTAAGSNNYLNGRNWIANCKNKTDIVTFSKGLSDSGQFILITAGG